MRLLSVLSLLFLVSAGPRPTTVIVMVATRDFAAGEVVDARGMTQRAVPREWVGKSIVLPDAASYIVNQPTFLPILSGDLMRWPFFDTRRGMKTPAACGESEASAVVAVRKARAVLLERR